MFFFWNFEYKRVTSQKKSCVPYSLTFDWGHRTVVPKIFERLTDYL